MTLLEEQIKTERKIKLILKRIIANKRYNLEINELARKALNVSKHFEQQYLAQSKQEEKGLCIDGDTSDGVITTTNEEKV